MKKLILSIALVLFANSAIAAGPFLVCEPQADLVRQYKVFVDAREPVIVDAVPVSATHVRLYYDVSWLPDGKHTIAARAMNVFGESETSDPFVFLKGPPPRPTKLKFSTK